MSSRNSKTPLTGRVCLVTGASRGVGKGIALQLAEKGAKVYITGRTLDTPKGSSVSGSLRDTAREIEARGGTCIPVQCDHSKDDEIEQLFELIKRENDGQLDILVNNAYSAVNRIFSSFGQTFWELPPTLWDEFNNVGLRNHYICSVYAARLMVPRKQGLIVNISAPGGLRYMMSCAYGIGKEGCDRMAADCAIELHKHNVAFVSLWPGSIGTETVVTHLDNEVQHPKDEKSRQDAKRNLAMFTQAESAEFPGQCIASLATDPDLMKMSGKILLTADLGRRYGLKDKAGHTPMDFRQIKCLLQMGGFKKLASFVPGFIRIPKWLVWLSGNKLF